MNKLKLLQTALASSAAVAIVLGGLWAADSSSSAKTTQRSICVNKETRDLTLRKNCRATENFLVEAEVFTKGGKSAYQTWLDLGNKGTEAQFIASLAGSSGGSQYNPLTNRRCADAIAQVENMFGRLVMFKDVWNYVEQNSNCKVSETSYEINYYFPDLNDVTTDVTVTVDSTLPKTVERFSNRPAEYVVPVELEWTLNLKSGWIVCNTSHPLYGNTDFTTLEEFARWAEIENIRIPESNSYKKSTTALITRSGISLGQEPDEDIDSSFYVPVCKEDLTSNLGWHLARVYIRNYVIPTTFSGQNIHYISEWGWE